MDKLKAALKNKSEIEARLSAPLSSKQKSRPKEFKAFLENELALVKRTIDALKEAK